MNFSIIVAHDLKKGIGKNNKLPWRIKGDMDYFKNTTTNVLNQDKINAVIMGRNTWKSIPKKFRPLENRLNIILSKKYDDVDSQLTFKSLDDSLKYLKTLENIESVFVIGGQQLYEEAIKHDKCEKLIITEINKEYDCDTFFPEYKEYKEIWTSILYDEGLYRHIILKKN